MKLSALTHAKSNSVKSYGPTKGKDKDSKLEHPAKAACPIYICDFSPSGVGSVICKDLIKLQFMNAPLLT